MLLVILIRVEGAKARFTFALAFVRFMNPFRLFAVLKPGHE